MQQLVVVAGPNGTGKSSFVKAFKDEYGLTDFEYINPDIYAVKFFSDIVEEEARYHLAFELAEYKCEEALKENRNIIIETVNSTTRKFDFYRECKSKGYNITVVYVCTNSYQININRVAKRKAQGGHDVPTEKIISRYQKSLDNMFELSLFADVLYVYDNSNENGQPALCYYKDKNESKLVYEPKWVIEYFIKKLSEY